MKKLLTAIVAAVVVIVAIMFIEIVPTGYVGVVYSPSHGVEDKLLPRGWHPVPPYKKVKEFTVGTEQIVLTKDKRKGSDKNESFRVATSDNASIEISFQMDYNFIEERIVDTFNKFKGMDGEDIVNTRVKTVLKSSISEVTNEYSMMEIYSGNRREINDKIKSYLNEKLGKQYGIAVTDAAIVDVHPDEQLKAAINNRIEAQQRADQAKIEQEKAIVEAETELIKANNEAEVKIAKAKGEAEANKELSASITPELIQMKEAEARLAHGWVEVQGANTVVKEN